MRFLFTTFAARPHLYPMVPLAWSCLTAGHEVRVASTPSLQDAICGTGLPAVSVGTDIDAERWFAGGNFRPHTEETDTSEYDPWKRVTRRLAEKQYSVCEAMVDDLVEFGRRWSPDAIVHDPVTFAGPVAAEVLGIPSVSHLYGLARLLRLEIEDWVGETPRPGFLELFQRWDSTPRVDPTAWIDPCPPSLRWPGQRPIDPRHPMRYISYNGPGSAPRWLLDRAERPRVCVTWGTSQQKKLGPAVFELFGRIVGEIAKHDVDVLLLTGGMSEAELAHLGTLPGNVRPLPWVPLNLLLPHCSAIVHTGGTGVMLTAAQAGIPQMGVTKIPEGEFNAIRVAAAGAGLQVRQDDLTDGAVGEGVGELLYNPAFAEAARALREEMAAQPAPAMIVPILEELAASAR